MIAGTRRSVTRVALRSLRGAASAAPAVSTLPTPTFAEVKFQKEDVDQVMTELPSFNYYEMKEPQPNPYRGITLDQSILVKPPAPVLVAPKVQFSKLENGMKIASVDNQGLTAQLGIYVSAGSRFENASNFGVSHMASLMAFKSTAHLSHLRTVKTLEQMGANASTKCTAGREQIVYSCGVAREFVPLVVPVMVGNVLFPRLLPWEVKAAHKALKEENAALEADPDAMVNSLLYKAAYCNNTLGFQTNAQERSLSHFTPETIRSFLLEHFAPERMVLVGVNVGHDDLSKWAMRSFADYNAIPMKPRETAKAAYTGGDIRIETSNTPFCHLAIGLESIAWGQKELAPVSLLQTILGSGSAVSNDIGSGVLSRISTQVVGQNPYVESCAAFNTSYSDGGVFGVYGVCQPEKAAEMASSMTKALTGLTTVSKEELARAKAMLKNKLYRETQDSGVAMDDIGTQLLMQGRYGAPTDFAKIIDGVTEKDLAAAAKKLLSSKPTLAAYGDTHTVPHLSVVEAALKA